MKKKVCYILKHDLARYKTLSMWREQDNVQAVDGSARYAWGQEVFAHDCICNRAGACSVD